MKLIEDYTDYDRKAFYNDLKKILPAEGIDHHESDLYFRVTPESTELLKKYGLDKAITVSRFIDNIEHKPWYEIMFAYSNAFDENLKEFVETPLNNVPLLGFLRQIGIPSSKLEYKNNDSEFAGHETYTYSSSSSTISNIENKIKNIHAELINSYEDDPRSPTRYYRDYLIKDFIIHFNYSNDGNSKIVVFETDGVTESHCAKASSLHEQAMTKEDAMNRCMNLGNQFVKHFDKIYNDTDAGTIKHHASEMQCWLEQVNSIKLKSNNKLLPLDKKMDWFFTNGSDADTLFKDEAEADTFNEFINFVVNTNDVILSLEKLGILNESLKEATIDLDEIAIDVANKLDYDVLGEENWIEIFPVEDADGKNYLSLEVTGPNDAKRFVKMFVRNGRIEVAFRNGSEAMCDSVDNIARFIAGEFGVSI